MDHDRTKLPLCRTHENPTQERIGCPYCVIEELRDKLEYIELGVAEWRDEALRLRAELAEQSNMLTAAYLGEAALKRDEINKLRDALIRLSEIAADALRGEGE